MAPVRSAREPRTAIAAVVYPVPSDGPEQYTKEVFLIPRDVQEPVFFGRGASCSIRFGHLPLADTSLPRVAGAFELVRGRDRLQVECLPSAGARALELHQPGHAAMRIPVGDAYGPGAHEFEVGVHGERVWWLSVRWRGADAAAPALRPGEAPTEPLTIRLKLVQQEVLDAYAAPVRAGGRDPATHKEVAARLHRGMTSVRDSLAEIYAEMFRAGVPLLEVADKRIAVVDALFAHSITINDLED